MRLPKKITSVLSSVIDRAKYQLWASSQYPDPQLIYERGGMFSLTNYLQQCSSGDITKQILAKFGADIHPDAFPIGPRVTVHEAGESYANLTVGPHVHIGKEVFLDLTDRIVFEQSAALGMRAVVLTHLNLGDDYPQKPAARLIPKKQAPTIFRRGCSVGAGAVILAGVEIGEDAVVNAGVVVDRDVPPRTIVRSSPSHRDYRIPDSLFDKVRRTGGLFAVRDAAAADAEDDDTRHAAE